MRPTWRFSVRNIQSSHRSCAPIFASASRTVSSMMHRFLFTYKWCDAILVCTGQKADKIRSLIRTRNDGRPLINRITEESVIACATASTTVNGTKVEAAAEIAAVRGLMRRDRQRAYYRYTRIIMLLISESPALGQRCGQRRERREKGRRTKKNIYISRNPQENYLGRET